jgi:hypothetical protein
MADTIGIILEYLHRHNFSRAETVLREEVSRREQSNGPTPIPLSDDLDLDVAIYLKSMQAKAAQKHHEVEVVPDKRAHDKLVTEVKPSAPAGLGVKEGYRGQVVAIQPATKLEDPEPLFMEFEVSQLEYPTKPKSVLGVVNSSSPVSDKTTVDRRRSPVRCRIVTCVWFRFMFWSGSPMDGCCLAFVYEEQVFKGSRVPACLVSEVVGFACGQRCFAGEVSSEQSG